MLTGLVLVYKYWKHSDEVEILHNDFTSTNVLLGHPTTLPLQFSSAVCTVGTGRYQILVIDCVKAAKTIQGNFLYLRQLEKLEY